MVETFVQKTLPWLDAAGPQPAHVLFCSASLHRDLADLPFPARCSEDELRTAQERVVNVLDSEGYLAKGQFLHLSDLDAREVLFLQERDLITEGFIAKEGASGVYVSDDQMLSIMVNEADHLCIRAHASGLDLEAAHAKVNEVDDVLSRELDYAFDDKLGYLTSAVGTVGTGLVMRAVLHLPGLAMANRIHEFEQKLRNDYHELRGGAAGHSVSLDEIYKQGDLVEVSNAATLGRSEAEIVFHLNHKVAEIVEADGQSRDTILAESPRGVEDRLGRALGVAREARLLESGEGNALLSSLRWGVQAGKVDGITYKKLNEVFMASRRGHLEMRYGHDDDPLALSGKRADLFRTSFS